MIEIERKFLPPQLPREHLSDAGEHMRQGYLAIDGTVAVRIRITDRAAVLTVKGGGGMARTEVESTVTVDEAEALWALTEGRRIDKVRHRVPLDGQLVAEVDVYAGDLDGLCTVEVEFDSEAAASAFEPPDWFGRDVTGEHGWSNAALARDGRPDR
jgi:adenylate cyclase